MHYRDAGPSRAMMPGMNGTSLLSACPDYVSIGDLFKAWPHAEGAGRTFLGRAITPPRK